MPSQPAHKWQRRKEARPGEIMDAALELFVEKGFAATRLEDVAQRAGVSKGTLYLYFPSKAELFKAVVSEIVVPEVARGEQRAAGHEGSASDVLRDLVDFWWVSVAESRLSGIPKLIISEAGNFPELARFFIDEVVRRARRLFVQVIRNGVESGEFRDCDANHVARAIMGALVFNTIYMHSLAPFDSEGFEPRKIIETHLTALLRGLKPDSGDGGPA